MFAASAGFISTLVAELPRLPGTPVPTLFVTALAATVCALCSPMALLDTFRYVNFIKEEETQNSTEGKNAGGIPRFNGEATRLGEYTWRVRARMAREAEMDPGEVKKQGPLGLRLVEQLSGPALRVAQQMAQLCSHQQGGRGKAARCPGYFIEAKEDPGGPRALRGRRLRGRHP